MVGIIRSTQYMKGFHWCTFLQEQNELKCKIGKAVAFAAFWFLIFIKKAGLFWLASLAL